MIVLKALTANISSSWFTTGWLDIGKFIINLLSTACVAHRYKDWLVVKVYIAFLTPCDTTPSLFTEQDHLPNSELAISYLHVIRSQIWVREYSWNVSDRKPYLVLTAWMQQYQYWCMHAGPALVQPKSICWTVLHVQYSRDFILQE